MVSLQHLGDKVVRIDFQFDAYTDEALESFKNALLLVYALPDVPVVLVLDLTHLPAWPPWDFIYDIAQFLREHQADIAMAVEFSMIIIDSPVLQQAVEGLFLLVPPQRPVYFHTETPPDCLDSVRKYRQNKATCPHL